MLLKRPLEELKEVLLKPEKTDLDLSVPSI